MSNRFFRQYAKKFYKNRKHEERKTGFRINQLTQELHHEAKFKRKEDEDKEYLKNLLNELMELRQASRFKQEFPSFSTFFDYVKKEKLTYNDLKELEDGADS